MHRKKIPENNFLFFRRQLLAWAAEVNRPMPWKGETDPYLIWLSEIILQQTRVEQGLPYFLRFRKRFPKVELLAGAPEDEVMKLWEGLGYYSRARHLHAAAKYIAYELNGQFPDNYQDILRLKGVGPYTAAAIASFGFNLPHAVLDGNVFRVLSRFFDCATPIDSTAGKRFFGELAQRTLDTNQPARYNQAIMDFGALLCTPQKPACHHCPLSSECTGLAADRIDRLPVKSKRMQRRQRNFHFLLFNTTRQVFIQKRREKDIWQNLYQFPLIETSQTEFSTAELMAALLAQKMIASLENIVLRSRSLPRKQTLTHQEIVATFWEFDLENAEIITTSDLILVERKNLSKFAFPKIVDWYLGDNSLYLNLQ